jgi:hypothetical protein
MTDFSFSGNICYKKFNENVKIYLKNFEIILKIFPIEITKIIMNYNDPRKYIHLFDKEITIGGVCVRPCSMCGQKIVF